MVPSSSRSPKILPAEVQGRAKRGQGSGGWRGPSSVTRQGCVEGQGNGELPRPSTNWALKRPETEPGEGTRRGGTGDAPSEHRGPAGDGSSVVLICCDGRGSPVAFRPARGLARLGREGEVSFRRKLSSSSSSPPFKSLSLFVAIAALLSGFCCTRAEDKVLVQYSYIFSHLLKLGLAESAALRPPRLAPICREASRHHVRPARRGHRGHSVSVTCHGAAADPASPRCRLTAP